MSPPTPISLGLQGAFIEGTSAVVIANNTILGNISGGSADAVGLTPTQVNTLLAASGGTWAQPGTIGSSTPNTGAFTTLSTTGEITLAPTTLTGATTTFTLTAPARSAITTTVECTEFLITLGTQTWAAGTVATQRFVHITAPTVAFASASTMTSTATLTIDGAPIQGTNATLTKTMALNVVAGLVNMGGTLAVTGACTLDSGASGSSFGGALTISGATTHNGAATFAPSVTTGGTTSLTLTAPTRSAIPTTAECTEILVTLGTQTWATGTVATQRFIHITAPTVAFAATSTMTSSATVTIDNAPQAGTHATLTTAYALNVVAGLTNLGGGVTTTTATLTSTLTLAGGTLLSTSGALTNAAGAVTIAPPTNAPTGTTKWVYMTINNNGANIYALCASA